jgi:Transketolase, pyrimidine binding domain
VFKAVGVVPEQELMTGYRRFGQRLEGHPTPVLPWVDVATGSLGQVLRGPHPEPVLASQQSAVPAGAGAALPEYAVGDKMATRKAYSDALVALGALNPKVVALDGEVKNSAFALQFARVYPEWCFEMFIAEQQMVAAATGLARPRLSGGTGQCSQSRILCRGRQRRRADGRWHRRPGYDVGTAGKAGTARRVTSATARRGLLRCGNGYPS